jgi:hypothetical protein
MVQLTGTGTSKRAKWCWRWCGCRCGCIDGADVLIRIELLHDMCHMESRFGVLREIISFGARYVHGLRLMLQSLRNHFGSTCWYS